jgi:hypothetical protein
VKTEEPIMNEEKNEPIELEVNEKIDVKTKASFLDSFRKTFSELFEENDAKM